MPSSSSSSSDEDETQLPMEEDNLNHEGSEQNADEDDEKAPAQGAKSKFDRLYDEVTSDPNYTLVMRGERKLWRSKEKSQKQGKWTKEEEKTLMKGILAYLAEEDLGTSKDAVIKFLSLKSYKGYKRCWQEIARCLPDRSVLSVREHGESLNPSVKRGGYTDEEENLLLALYKRHGDTYKAMKLIAIEMGRSRTSIRDKLRALLSLGDGKERYVGTWSKSDDRKLLEIVERLKKETERKKVPEGGQFWIDVAKRMVDRNYSQCRQRYFLKFNGSFPEHLDQGWTPELDWELLQNLKQYTEIQDVNWTEVSKVLKCGSGKHCYTRWRILCKRHCCALDQPFQDIVEYIAKPLKEALDDFTNHGIKTPRFTYPKAFSATYVAKVRESAKHSVEHPSDDDKYSDTETDNDSEEGEKEEEEDSEQEEGEEEVSALEQGKKAVSTEKSKRTKPQAEDKRGEKRKEKGKRCRRR